MAYSCETAANFRIYRVVANWEQFMSDLRVLEAQFNPKEVGFSFEHGFHHFGCCLLVACLLKITRV